MLSPEAILAGLVFGAGHALEADHLAAVSVLAAESPTSWRGAVLGLFWGAGHALALLVVGVLLGVFSIGMPEALEDGFELAVGLMLIGIGLRALHRAVVAEAREAAVPHVHGESGQWSLGRRPLLVGLMHGLAGSGALTALAMATLPALWQRLLFIALFGIGSIAGMAILSGLLGWRLAALGRRPSTARGISCVAGLISTGIGVVWGWQLLHKMLA